MNCETVFPLLVLIGLAFNIAGTFLIVFSIKFPGEVPIETANLRLEVPEFKRCKFKWGVWILTAGFIFQFVSVLLELIINADFQSRLY